MVNPRNVLINVALEPNNDESSSFVVVEDPFLMDIIYGVGHLIFVYNVPSGSFGSEMDCSDYENTQTGGFRGCENLNVKMGGIKVFRWF